MSMRGTFLASGIFVRSAPCAYFGKAASSLNLASIVQFALPASRMRRISPMVAGFVAMIDGLVCLLLDTLFGDRVLRVVGARNYRCMRKVRRMRTGMRRMKIEVRRMRAEDEGESV